MYEYVYGIFYGNWLKIGYWTGTVSALRSRYKTCSVDEEMIVFETAKDRAPEVEAQLHKACDAYKMRGEMFSMEARSTFMQIASVVCLDACHSLDMDERHRRIEKKRFANLAKENVMLLTALERGKTEKTRLKDNLERSSVEIESLKRQLNDAHLVITDLKRKQPLDQENGALQDTIEGDNDPYAQFINETYSYSSNQSDRVSNAEVNIAFKAWCKRGTPISSRKQLLLKPGKAKVMLKEAMLANGFTHSGSNVKVNGESTIAWLHVTAKEEVKL